MSHSLDHSPDRSLGRSLGRSPGRSPGRSRDRSRGRSLHVRSLARLLDRSLHLSLGGLRARLLCAGVCLWLNALSHRVLAPKGNNSKLGPSDNTPQNSKGGFP